MAISIVMAMETDCGNTLDAACGRTSSSFILVPFAADARVSSGATVAVIVVAAAMVIGAWALAVVIFFRWPRHDWVYDQITLPGLVSSLLAFLNLLLHIFLLRQPTPLPPISIAALIAAGISVMSYTALGVLRICLPRKPWAQGFRHQRIPSAPTPYTTDSPYVPLVTVPTGRVAGTISSARKYSHAPSNSQVSFSSAVSPLPPSVAPQVQAPLMPPPVTMPMPTTNSGALPVLPYQLSHLSPSVISTPMVDATASTVSLVPTYNVSQNPFPPVESNQYLQHQEPLSHPYLQSSAVPVQRTPSLEAHEIQRRNRDTYRIDLPEGMFQDEYELDSTGRLRPQTPVDTSMNQHQQDEHEHDMYRDHDAAQALLLEQEHDLGQSQAPLLPEVSAQEGLGFTLSRHSSRRPSD